LNVNYQERTYLSIKDNIRGSKMIMWNKNPHIIYNKKQML